MPISCTMFQRFFSLVRLVSPSLGQCEGDLENPLVLYLVTYPNIRSHTLNPKIGNCEWFDGRLRLMYTVELSSGGTFP